MVKIWKKWLISYKYMNTKWTQNELKMNWTKPKIWATITHNHELKISKNMSQIHELNWTERKWSAISFIFSHLWIFSIIHFYFIFLPVIPKGRPQIEDMVAPKGGGFLYKPGDWLSLNCTSQPSRPPTRLTWFVNGREVSCD